MSDRPLRILHLTLGADAGGLSRYITDLALAMHKLGNQVTVAGDTGAWQWLFDSMPFPYLQVPLKGGPIAFWKCMKRLQSFLRQQPVDLIHTHYRRATLLGRRIQGQGIPILYTVHLSHISLAWPRNLLTDFGDRSHVASPEAREWLTHDAGVSPEQISLIPHGIDTQHYAIADEPMKRSARQSLNLSPDDLVAIYVGRLDYPKNEDWMIDLAAAVRGKIPNLKILLVGEGPHEQDLRDRIALENLDQQVHLLGYRDPLPVYQAADAILLPSLREGFSLVCAEAMSVGVPALRTRTSGTSSLIAENVTGRSVPIDHDAFIAGAIDFLSDSAALKRMGMAAARLIREKYTFEQQLIATLDLYRSLTTLRNPN